MDHYAADRPRRGQRLAGGASGLPRSAIAGGMRGDETVGHRGFRPRWRCGCRRLLRRSLLAEPDVLGKGTPDEFHQLFNVDRPLPAIRLWLVQRIICHCAGT